MDVVVSGHTVHQKNILNAKSRPAKTVSFLIGQGVP